jgi:hypothetical protein
MRAVGEIALDDERRRSKNRRAPAVSFGDAVSRPALVSPLLPVRSTVASCVC